jgi:hypothetical protein
MEEHSVQRARRVVDGLTFEDPAVSDAVGALMRAVEGVHGSVEAAHMNIRDLERPPRNLPGDSHVIDMVYAELSDTGWDGDSKVPSDDVDRLIRSALLRIVQRLAKELDATRAECRESIEDMLRTLDERFGDADAT